MKLSLRPTSLITILALFVLGVYLFVSAPPKLPQDGDPGSEPGVPVEQLFRLLAKENASIRALYTSEIVGPGLKQGLKFQEDWKKREVHAGPLPALFLRETSALLQRDVPGLNLFLGSDYPIVSANQFKGTQVEQFKIVRSTGNPQFFQDPSTKLYTAMFPDLASAKPCVVCHNEHDKTPKSDWALNDVMGATTWLYPRKTVPMLEVIRIIQAYRRSAMTTYEIYLDKVRQFPVDDQPVIGDKWPRDGRFIPNAATFAKTIDERNSPSTLNALLGAADTLKSTAKADRAPSS